MIKRKKWNEQRERLKRVRGMETEERAREKDKEAEQESNHLSGLKVSVRLTYSPEAKTMQDLALAASARMKDEPSSRGEARDMKSRTGM